MKSLVRAAAVSFAIACAGCATSGGPTYSQISNTAVPGQGSVVVYRWSSLKGGAWTHRVFLDGEHVADLRGGEFTQLTVPTGTHKISIGTMKNPNYLSSNLEISAGGSYFLEDHPGYNLYAPDSLNAVDQTQAEKRLNSGYSFHAPLNSSQ